LRKVDGWQKIGDMLSETTRKATRATAQAVGFYNNMRTRIPAIRAARMHVARPRPDRDE